MVTHQTKKQRTGDRTAGGAATPPSPVPPTPRRSSRRSGTPSAIAVTENVGNKRKKSLPVDSDGEESVATSNDGKTKSTVRSTGDPELLDTNSPQGKRLKEPGMSYFYPMLEHLEKRTRSKNAPLISAIKTLHTIIQTEESNLSKFLVDKGIRETMKESVDNAAVVAASEAAEKDAEKHTAMIRDFGKILFELCTILAESNSANQQAEAAKQFSVYVIDKIVSKTSKEVLEGVLEKMGLQGDTEKKVDATKRVAVALLGNRSVEWFDDWITQEETKTVLRTEKLNYLINKVAAASTAPPVAPQSTQRLVELYSPDPGRVTAAISCGGSALVPAENGSDASFEKNYCGPFSAAAVALGGNIASTMASVQMLSREDPSLLTEVERFLHQMHNLPVKLDYLAEVSTAPTTPPAGGPLSCIFSLQNLLQNDIVYSDLQQYIRKTKAEALAEGATEKRKVAYTDWLRDIEKRIRDNPLKADGALDESELVGAGRLNIYDMIQVFRHIATGGYGAVLRAMYTYKGQTFDIALKAELLSEGMEVADALRSLETHGRVADQHDKVSALLAYQFIKLSAPVCRKKERKPDAQYCLLTVMELGDGTLKDEISRGNRSEEEKAKFGVDASLKIMGMVLTFEKKKIIHRDIKPENLLLVSSDEQHEANSEGKHVLYKKLKMCDFGISKPDTVHTRPAGTDNYRAPEVQSAVSVSIKSDVFSVGMILFQCVVGTTAPRASDDDVHLENAETQLRAAIHDHNWKGDLIKVIMGMIQNDPTKRLNPADANDLLGRVDQQMP